MKNIVTIERTYLPECTLSRITTPSGSVYAGIENPWLDNRPNVSCIPEGMYIATLEPSNLTKRLTGGEYDDAWRLHNVVGRSAIIVHVGNTAADTEGCLIIGLRRAPVNNKFGVVDSKLALRAFREDLSEYSNLVFWYKSWNLYK